MTVRYVTEAELRQEIDGILARYPWFADYAVDCACCVRWEIAAEHGYDAGEAWERYDVAVWLLTGRNAGKVADDD